MKIEQYHILLMFAGLIGLAACSGGEGVEPATVPEEGQTAISFIGGQQEEQAVTRAATGLETLLNEKTFKVWGYKNDAYDAGTGSYTSYQTVMPNYVVSWTANTAYTTTTNTNDWEYVGLGTGSDQEIKYWDFGANAYRFFGYAKGNATAAEHADPADPSSAIVTPATPQVAVTENGLAADAVSFTAEVDASTDAAFNAAPYFTRLWFSDGNPTNYPDRQFGRPVQLQFLKPFARVRFMFTFVEGVAKRKDLKNITFHPTDLEAHITTSGTVTVSYPLKGTATTESWTFTPGTNYLDAFLIDYYETPDPADVPAGVPANSQPTTWPNTTGKWYTVLPVASQGSYTLEVSVVTEQIKKVVVPAEYMQWKAGYEYTYKFKVTEKGDITIEVVQVAINEWENRKVSEHVVYNW